MSQATNWQGTFGSTESLDRLPTQEDNSLENLADEADLMTLLGRSLSILWKDWPRKMKLTQIPGGGTTYSLSGKCPHCGDSSVFVSVAGFQELIPATGMYVICQAMRCQGCLRFILGVAEWAGTTAPPTYVEHYPLGAPDDSVDKHVPPSIASDFSEALRCLWVKSYKATVAMCRRCVEASCKEKGAKGGNLKARIDDLAKRGMITDPLRRMAHRVRLTANEELHGQPDDLDTFTEPEAEAIVRFVREYFHHVYVMPALLDAYDEPQGEAAVKPEAS